MVARKEWEQKRGGYENDRKKHFERNQRLEAIVKKNGTKMKKEGNGGKKLGSITDSRCKMWRLIIRNLPFKTTADDLEAVFSDIGPLIEIVLPKCKDKRFPNSCAGFAFIQFQKRCDATKAMERLNMSEVFGRKVAIDWAAPKDTYETVMHEERLKSKKMKDEIKQEIASVDSSEAVEKMVDNLNIKEEVKSESDNNASDADDNASDADSDDEVRAEDRNQLKSGSAGEVREDKAVLEGRVVFIRNLSYETTDEVVKEALSKFGDISLAIICRYVGSDHSKGTAFVHYKTAEQANGCISAINQTPGVLIDGRRIFGHLALPKKQAAAMEKDKLEKKPKDKRNLHLLRAGFIRPGSASAADMSEMDANKRAQLAVSAREKLKNLHMFVSPTRLVVHNLPKSMTDKAFRSMCFIAANNPDAKITECRIWRDKNKLNALGEALSRGFGFINFSEHRDALAALKHLNNNPEIFTKEKRPIVEFSIENKAALRLREARLKKSQQKLLGSVSNLSDRSKRDLEETKKHLSAGGQKPLPSHLGPKLRRKKIKESKKIKKPVAKGTGAKKRKNIWNAPKTAPKKKKISRSKQLTKYLALSG